LAMINACVSHEMRTPLNSIIAFNVQKEGLYKELREELSSNQGAPDIKVKCLLIVDQLEKGRQCQESSSSIIKFLVQDLLDFAQLKAGKFRKNITRFNIIETVKSVLRI